MLCSASAHDSSFREGCNIPVTLSDDGAFGGFPPLANDVSPKKTSFLGNLMRRNSKKEEKGVTSPSWSIFSKKTSPPSSASSVVDDDKATAELIEQLQLEGRSDDEIQFHLSHIHDSPTVAPLTPPTPPQQQKGSTNIISQIFRDIQTAFKTEETYIVYPEFEDDLHRLTVGISSAPFYGALPPDMDLSYEELARLEPVYVGSKCVNNLPCCVHNGEPLPGDQTNCPVCLNDFAKGDSLKSLPCVHFYHKDCIDSWLLVGHTCPLCKLIIE